MARTKQGTKRVRKANETSFPDEGFKCVIGIDQSYSRTGISIAVDGKIKKITSVDLKNILTKTNKRLAVQEALRKAIKSCMTHYSASEIVVLCERLRTYTAGSDLRPTVIKMHAALIAYIVDTAQEFGIETYSVDTRCWKAAILGSSSPIFAPIEGVKNPQKFGSVRYIIDLGFKEQISKYKNNGGFAGYDDDAADSGCIALYGFHFPPKVAKEQ